MESSARVDDDAQGVFMKPEIQALLIELSKSFIHDVFDGRTESCLSLLESDALWLSPFRNESDDSVDGFQRFCDHVRDESFRVILVREAYELGAVRFESCTILMRGFIYIGSGGQGSVLGQPIRMMLQWRLQRPATVRVLCLEMTFPIDREALYASQILEPEMPPHPDGWDKRIELKDDQGVTHFIDEDRLIYVEAQGRKALVHCDDGDLTIQDGIGALEAKLGEQFVRLHRTYLVNGWKVKSLSSQGAIMADGSVLPVPVRRLVALRDEINKVKRPRQLSLSDLEKMIEAAIVNGGDDANAHTAGAC